MAAESVLDDSKNESGIPRAVFVVRYLCMSLKTYMLTYMLKFTENQLPYEYANYV